MANQKEITATADQLACFVSSIIIEIYQRHGKPVHYEHMKLMREHLTEDIAKIDFKSFQYEFDRMLYICHFAEEVNQEDDQTYWNEIMEIFNKK